MLLLQNLSRYSSLKKHEKKKKLTDIEKSLLTLKLLDLFYKEVNINLQHHDIWREITETTPDKSL